MLQHRFLWEPRKAIFFSWTEHLGDPGRYHERRDWKMSLGHTGRFWVCFNSNVGVKNATELLVISIYWYYFIFKWVPLEKREKKSARKFYIIRKMHEILHFSSELISLSTHTFGFVSSSGVFACQGRLGYRSACTCNIMMWLKHLIKCRRRKL